MVTMKVVSTVIERFTPQPGEGAVRTTSGQAAALYSHVATCSAASLSSSARVRLRVGPSSAATKTQNATTTAGAMSTWGASMKYGSSHHAAAEAVPRATAA
jgi:diaminopimelate decarboxylase